MKPEREITIPNTGKVISVRGSVIDIDVGKSVSRVGGNAQRAVYRAVTGDLKLAYAQFEELETFAQFGARMDDHTRHVIEHGKRIRACLKQPEFSPVSVPAQIFELLALSAGLLDDVPLERMSVAEKALLEAAETLSPELLEELNNGKKLKDEHRKSIIESAKKVLSSFPTEPTKNP